MRLINTKTLQLQTFASSEKAGRYAILSHTWGADEEEVKLEELAAHTQRQQPTAKKGFDKIKQSCILAREEFKLDFLWVDTCCIDKSSSAELTEAINSMFKWYRDSTVCIAFLSDLEPGDASLEGCKWFQRGWTLQELLAPSNVRFYDKAWRFRGDKSSLQSKLEVITRISPDILNGAVSLAEVPVAVRMSWAATRETTREEDRAYSLLGIFQVNMPMLYGEGNKAFVRLQEEIIRDSPDMSIFAWTRAGASGDGREDYSGLLAPSPAEFKDAGSLKVAQDAVFDIHDFSISNRGLKFRVPLAAEGRSGRHCLPVNHHGQSVSDGEGGGEYSLGVHLRQIGPGLYVRALPHLLGSIQRRSPVKSLQVAKVLSEKEAAAIRERVLRISWQVDDDDDMRLSEVEPVGCWDPSERVLYAGHTGVFLGFLRFTPKWADEFDYFVLVCRFDSSRDAMPWRLDLVAGDDWPSMRPRYHEVYGYRHDAFLQPRSGLSLDLPHLFDESRRKQVVASLVPDELSVKGYLSLEVVDLESEHES
ncbi:hypothetical protein ACJ41O_008718 [Fusarium nematophilum]